MSYDDPNFNFARPPFAPNPLSLGVPLNYVLLNRRFENVGEFGYAYNPASTRRHAEQDPGFRVCDKSRTGRYSISLLITRQPHAQAL